MVGFTTIVSGTVSSFDRDEYIDKLALFSGVDPSAISLNVTTASVLVDAAIFTADEPSQLHLQARLAAFVGNLSGASNALGVTVEEVKPPKTWQIVTMPTNSSPLLTSSLPPLSPPLPPLPGTTPALLHRTDEDNLASSKMIAAIVVPVLVLVIFIGLYIACGFRPIGHLRLWCSHSYPGNKFMYYPKHIREHLAAELKAARENAYRRCFCGHFCRVRPVARYPPPDKLHGDTVDNSPVDTSPNISPQHSHAGDVIVDTVDDSPVDSPPANISPPQSHADDVIVEVSSI